MEKKLCLRRVGNEYKNFRFSFVDKHMVECYGFNREKRGFKMMKTFIKKQPPGRLIAMGFAMVILIGTCLLLTPWSVRQGVTVKPVDALFSATSAVCVTGLVTIDTADHFTAFGQAIMGLLIQIGGLGVSSVGVGLVIAAGKKVSFKSRTMAKEALNVDNYKGVVKLVKAVLCMTLGFELTGALLSFLVFSRDYPFLHAVGISVFHSVASFNNAGLDILGGLQNLIPYGDDVFLNIVTSALVIVGGIGFPVILDVARNRSFKKLTLHSKVVLVTSGGLLLSGTLLLKLTDHLTWMQAFFTVCQPERQAFPPAPWESFPMQDYLSL